MDKRVFEGLLYDFYGELLTQKQKYIFEGYYMEDLSFQEIGELYGITKQAVSDMLKRTLKQLSKYEEKLGYVKKFAEQREAIEKAIELIDLGEKDEVKNILNSLLD